MGIFLGFIAICFAGVVAYFIAKSRWRDPRRRFLLGPIGWLVVASLGVETPNAALDGANRSELDMEKVRR